MVFVPQLPTTFFTSTVGRAVTLERRYLGLAHVAG